MGGMGHFSHDIFAPLLLCLALWGIATGVGFLRAWRWARVSMLVFGSVLATFGVFMAVPFLVLPWAGLVWWEVLGRGIVGLLFLLVPVAIMIRWYIYFSRNDVRAYFTRSVR
jgi:hypothetical protein